ncbi:unnamed protein product [Rhodiola kirilowii]
MTILGWNCRGLGSHRAFRALRDVIKSSRASIVGLIETKASKFRCEEVRVKLGFKNCFCVPARGRSGGLALLWNGEVEVTICNFSAYHIDFAVHMSVGFRVTLFYGAPQASQRHRSWDLIRQLHQLQRLSWCLIGDFNEVLNYADVSKNAWRRSHLMSQFRQVLDDCNLSELEFKGYKYTYTNKRKGGDEIRCRLDRVLVNESWRSLFSYAYVSHLVSHHSDHSPIQLCLMPPRRSSFSLFRYEIMWSRDPRFKDLVSSQWHQMASMSNFMDKLEGLKQPIRKWNRTMFGDVNKHLNDLRGRLSEIRQLPRTDDNITAEEHIEKEIDEWLHREELMWRQRSRVSWLKEGDNNTSFFHRKATSRRKLNTILQLRNRDGHMCYDQTDLESIGRLYFLNIFSSSRHISSEDIQNYVSSMPRKVNASHNDILTQPYSEREVFAALSQLNPSKAPGLDGFHAAFFQQHWNIIKTDFLSLCLSVLNDGVIPPTVNDTLIVLIPKQKNKVEKMEELRPISLTTVASKVIAKAIVNRLQLVLPEVISAEQSAFLKGHLITDNFIIAHECAHFIKNVTRGKKIVGSLKLDMSKAYDRMEWDFLELIMIQLGFDKGWVRRIMNYVSSVRYCVRVNDNVSDFLIPQRGLRQGDPLSPYLFIICTEWISYYLHSLHHNAQIKGLRICRRSPYLTHLFFADDALFFFGANHHTAPIFRDVLAIYEHLSGQLINYDKSEVVLSRNASEEIKKSFNEALRVKIVGHHKKYLGLPLVLDRKFSTNFMEILDRAERRTTGWCTINLSSGGKEVLIKAVLQALPQYFMHCFLIPGCILTKLEIILRKFWWSHKQEEHHMSWVKNSLLEENKEKGGLGFKNLKLLNATFLAKQAWRINQEPTKLVSQVMKARYFPNGDIFNASPGHRSSYCWRSILKGVELLKCGCDFGSAGDISWKHSGTGQYDVRSGYDVAQHAQMSKLGDEGQCSNSKPLITFWNTFWKLPLPRKIKILGGVVITTL